MQFIEDGFFIGVMESNDWVALGVVADRRGPEQRSGEDRRYDLYVAAGGLIAPTLVERRFGPDRRQVERRVGQVPMTMLARPETLVPLH